MSNTPNTPYGTLKAGWHLERIAEMRTGLQARPVSMQLIISDFCNNDCHFCAYRASNGLSVEQFAGVDKNGRPTHNPYRLIDTKKVMELLDDAKAIGVKSITFTGGGEPTVHPDHLAIMARALDMGFDCSLNTNGNILRDGWEKVLPRFKYVRVSVDASGPDEYAHVRKVPASTYQKVLDNIRALVDEVKRQGTDCIVGAGYVVTPESLDVYDGIKNLASTGCAYVRMASMQSTLGGSAFGSDGLSTLSHHVERAKALLETESFKVVNLFDSALGRKMSSPKCGMQELVLYVGANLHIYRCCYVAYSKLGDIGDLSSQRLRDWFVSEQKRKAIGDFDARSCSTCPLADKNDVIEYLASPDPVHVNFI